VNQRLLTDKSGKMMIVLMQSGETISIGLIEADHIGVANLQIDLDSQNAREIGYVLSCMAIDADENAK
jgi:hypothetical protein